MNVWDIGDARQRLDATLAALGDMQRHCSEAVLTMVASGASGLPLALVRELL